jgi:hypothetical protein
MCSDEEIHGVRALTTEILAVLVAFASEFSRPTWKNIQVLWSDKAIARTTPLLMGLFSFITLLAFSMHQTKALVSMETASWYNKKGELTFSDIIAIVRRSIWLNKYFSKSENQLDLDKCSEERINSLIYQFTLAA